MHLSTPPAKVSIGIPTLPSSGVVVLGCMGTPIVTYRVRTLAQTEGTGLTPLLTVENYVDEEFMIMLGDNVF
jgi:hypothetical protein